MVLLWRIVDFLNLFSYLIYIPVWFYYDFTCPITGSSISPIYIPVWFYYDCVVLWNQYAHLHLHSSMVLLWLLRSPCGQTTIFIYIPVWFYYDRAVGKYNSSPFIIYIPVWFYYDGRAVPILGINKNIYIPVWFYYDPFKYQYGKHASAMV